MSGLADDWQENRQTCVEVLCAYLRMPYEPNPGQVAPEPQRLAFHAAREVRRTVIRVIAAHVKKNAVMTWQGLNFDFTGAVFDGGRLQRAMLLRRHGELEGASFCGEVSFRDAEFSGTQVYFEDAQFTGGGVSFEGAHFSGGTVDLSDVGDWSFPPVHPWTVTQPAGVKLSHPEPGFLREGAATPQSKQPGK